MKRVDPPVPQGKIGNDRWRQVIEEVKAEEGSWCLVPGEHTRTVGNHIRKGRYPVFIPRGTADPERYMAQHWEVTQRKIKGKELWGVWLKWLG